MKIGQNRAPELKIGENFISWGSPARFYRPQGPRIDFLGPPEPHIYIYIYIYINIYGGGGMGSGPLNTPPHGP